MENLKNIASPISRLTANNYVISGLLFFISLPYGWYLLDQSSFAPGWDSYFYMNQTQSWFLEGTLHSPRLNIIYPLLISLQFLFQDYIISYKVLSSLALSSLIVAVYHFVYQQANQKAISILISLIFLVSPVLIYFSAQFTKNLIGIVIFLWCIYSISKRNLWLTIVLLVCLYFSHKLMLASALLYLFYYWAGTWFSKFRWLRPLIFISPLCVLVIAKPLSIDSWQLPTLSLFNSHHTTMTDYWILFIGCCFVLFVFVALKTLFHSAQPSNFTFALIGLFVFLNAPFLPWDLLGYSIRFQWLFLLLTPLLLVAFKLNTSRIKWLILAFPLFMFLNTKSYNPQKQDPPYIKYSFISQKLTKTNTFLNSELLICHKALAEYISFTSHKDVLPWGIPQQQINKKVLRLVFIPKENAIEFKSLIEKIAFTTITNEYILMKESDFQKIVIASSSSNLKNELTSWLNPTEVRK